MFRISHMYSSSPTGIRTPVNGLKTRCPRPLDDRAALYREGTIKCYYVFTILAKKASAEAEVEP